MGIIYGDLSLPTFYLPLCLQSAYEHWPQPMLSHDFLFYMGYLLHVLPCLFCKSWGLYWVINRWGLGTCTWRFFLHLDVETCTSLCQHLTVIICNLCTRPHARPLVLYKIPNPEQCFMQGIAHESFFSLKQSIQGCSD